MQNQNESKPAKRMLEINQEGEKLIVKVNYSSLELMQTCSRKAYYSLNQKLNNNGDSPALSFGTAMHKGLEHWYTLPVTERELAKDYNERAELMAYGHNLDTPAVGALESIRRAVLSGRDTLGALDDNDKRSLSQLIKIQRAYFKNYANDNLVVATDDQGPLIERAFEFRLFDSDKLAIDYHGQIDAVLQNIQSGVTMIVDHKTTATLGTEFYARCKPNPQYTGYVMGAQKCLGLKTDLFMINGIQVAKTKQEFARQITSRNEEDFSELSASVIKQVSIWLDQMNMAKDVGELAFPMSAPNPCSMYGSCQYLRVCEVPVQLRENVISSIWSKT